MDTNERAHAVAIFVVQLKSILAPDLVVDAGLLHLEAGGVNQHVEFVLFAFEYRPLLTDLGDTLAMGVDEMDVGTVIGRQIIVIEARALAHEHVPRLE